VTRARALHQAGHQDAGSAASGCDGRGASVGRGSRHQTRSGCTVRNRWNTNAWCFFSSGSNVLNAMAGWRHTIGQRDDV